MKKHGICQGDPTENGKGRTICNPEWVMAEQFFISRLFSDYEWCVLFAKVPKKIEQYNN